MINYNDYEDIAKDFENEEKKKEKKDEEEKEDAPAEPSQTELLLTEIRDLLKEDK